LKEARKTGKGEPLNVTVPDIELTPQPRVCGHSQYKTTIIFHYAVTLPQKGTRIVKMLNNIERAYRRETLLWELEGCQIPTKR
jgi:hypothetical protein